MIPLQGSIPTAASAALVALLAAGCAKNSTTTAAAATPTPVTVSAPAPAPPRPRPAPGPEAVVVTAPGQPIAVESHADQAAAAWAAIKDYPFDQRAAFLAGARQMAAMLDGQVAELDAKRASFAATVETKNWDFAMHDMRDSQAYFKAVVNEAAGATADIWQQEKDKVEAAWQKAQAAFDAVKTTVTVS